MGVDLSAEIGREYERYCLTDEQITHLEVIQKQRVAEATSGALRQVQQLLLLKGVGWQSSWPLVMEFFAYMDNGTDPLHFIIGLIRAKMEISNTHLTKEEWITMKITTIGLDIAPTVGALGEICFSFQIWPGSSKYICS